MRSRFKRAIALSLYVCLCFTTLATIGCDKSKLAAPPSRATLEAIAQGGRTAANVLAANVTLPDQLLTAGAISQELHDQLVKAVSEAQADAREFNDGMTQVLASETPDLKPLLPVALRLVQRIHALTASDLPSAWQMAFSVAEIGIQAIANYFALKVSQLHRAGFSDQQIFALAGVPYDPNLLRLIESYQKGSSASE